MKLAFRRVRAAFHGRMRLMDTRYDLVFAAHPDLAELDALHAYWHPEEAA